METYLSMVNFRLPKNTPFTVESFIFVDIFISFLKKQHFSSF